MAPCATCCANGQSSSTCWVQLPPGLIVYLACGTSIGGTLSTAWGLYQALYVAQGIQGSGFMQHPRLTPCVACCPWSNPHTSCSASPVPDRLTSEPVILSSCSLGLTSEINQSRFRSFLVYAQLLSCLHSAVLSWAKQDQWVPSMPGPSQADDSEGKKPTSIVIYLYYSLL